MLPAGVAAAGGLGEAAGGGGHGRRGSGLGKRDKGTGIRGWGLGIRGWGILLLLIAAKNLFPRYGDSSLRSAVTIIK